MSRKVLTFFVLLLLSAFLLSCAGRKTLQPAETYFALRPVEDLPVYDLENIPVNLEVVIDNVADMTTSYKNRAELYINGHLIRPEKPTSNIQKTYRYRLKLRPGIYEVHGYYYALDGFVERKYTIRPQTKVMVKPGTLTRVTCEIQKNWDGTPVDKKLLFSVAYEPLSGSSIAPEAPATIPKPSARSETPPAVPLTSRPPVQKPVPRQKAEKNLIVLQVNTAPSGANVIVDDRYIGQSPVRVLVDRTTSHILQLSLDGYEDVIKYLDHRQFGKENVIYFMHRMKPKK